MFALSSLKRAALAMLLVSAAGAQGRRLVITGAETSPKTVRSGETQVVMFKLVYDDEPENDHTVPYRISVNGKVLESDTLEERARFVQATWAPPAGRYEYLLEVDPENRFGLRASRRLKVPMIRSAPPRRKHPDRENPLGGSTSPNPAVRNLRVGNTGATIGSLTELQWDVPMLGIFDRDTFPYRVTVTGAGQTWVQTRHQSCSYPDQSGGRFAFTPPAAGAYRVVVELDPEHVLPEREADRADDRVEWTLQVEDLPDFMRFPRH